MVGMIILLGLALIKLVPEPWSDWLQEKPGRVGTFVGPVICANVLVDYKYYGRHPLLLLVDIVLCGILLFWFIASLFD